jgi:hypothetical protein
MWASYAPICGASRHPDAPAVCAKGADKWQVSAAGDDVRGPVVAAADRWGHQGGARVRAAVRDETGDGAPVGARFHTAAEMREGLVGARGFEPPTSSSRTMRAAKLRHAPTEVLSDQSRAIVARVGQARHRRRDVGALPEWTRAPGIPPGAASDAPAGPAAPARFRPSEPFGVPVHRLGCLPGPEVPGNRDPPVRTSHFAASAPTVRFRERAESGDPRVAREGRSPPHRSPS